VPPARVGGAIFITDGQIHDVPDVNQKLGFDAPVHALISGKPDEFDRRIEIVSAPRFGIVGEQQRMTFRVVDDGAAPGGSAEVTIRLNGNEIATEQAEPGTDVPFTFTVPRGGNNILEFAVNPVAGEVTETNNRAVHVLDGIRENLRVLLVSGEPHAGERAWRNLLKSDAAVDLVHFTILRPPERTGRHADQRTLAHRLPDAGAFRRQDQRIRPHHLRSVPASWRAADPLLRQHRSIRAERWSVADRRRAGARRRRFDRRDPRLRAVLPATPTGVMNEKAFFPRLSEEGKKHPVTRGLEGGSGRTAGLGPLVPYRRCGQAARPDGDGSGRRQAAAGPQPRRQGACRHAALRPGLAVGRAASKGVGRMSRSIAARRIG
jgi:hypothetical protein